MQPSSAWTAGMLARNAASTSSRLPGFVVIIASTWIIGFPPEFDRRAHDKLRVRAGPPICGRLARVVCGGGFAMARRGMKFGIFLAPFHRLGENPTLAMARDLELIEWLDWLGYDEAWIGEHHSAGWEIIASPELAIAQAAERTRNIMLGSGVTSLPYHHPFLVAQRSDAYMLGIEPVHLRRRMEESLEAIIRLLRCDEPVTMSTDWFEMREARLHLAPYSDPRFHIAVASTITPFGMVAAGKHGLGVLSIGARLPRGPAAVAARG